MRALFARCLPQELDSICEREMAAHPEVFISATTRDLGSFRREIKDALLSLQIFPIDQSSFTLAYGPLTEMLHSLIGRCVAAFQR
jgi:hypothetical protein